MEDVELLQNENEKFPISNETKKTIIIFSSVFAGILIIFIIFASIFRSDSSNVENFSNFISLPTKYFIQNNYAIPSKDDFNRSSSSLFAIISILESFYRKQGIEKGYLTNSQTVKFSPDYFHDYITNFCSTDRSIGSCRESPNFSFSDYVMILKGLSDPGKTLIPEAAYPYLETKDSTLYNTITTDIIKNNPFSFTIKNSSFRSTVDTIKELLYTSQAPIEITLPMPETRYWYNCNFNSFINDTEWCQRGTSDIAPFHYKWDRKDDSTCIYHLSGETTITNAREMVLVGYDDELIEEIPFNITELPPAKGAFVIKNSWGSTGHSLEYLKGSLSPNLERAMCPNAQDPMNWKPLDLRCVEAHGLDSNECIATPLECIVDVSLGICSPSLTYYLVANPYSDTPSLQFTETGVNVPTIVSKSDSGILSQPEPFLNAPFEFMNNAFRAIDAKTNDPNHCGHMVISYSVLDQIIKESGPQTDALSAISLDVEFSDVSYANSKSKGATYALTKNSTYEFILNEGNFHFIDL